MAEQLELLCVEQNDETNFPPEYIEAACLELRALRKPEEPACVPLIRSCDLEFSLEGIE